MISTKSSSGEPAELIVESNGNWTPWRRLVKSINKLMAIFFLLCMLIAKISLAGECLDDSKDVYLELKEIYKNAKTGTPNGEFSGRCWQDKEYDDKIYSLLKKMSIDKSLDSITRSEAIRMYGPSDIATLLSVIEESKGEVRESAIIELLLLQYDMPSKNNPDFNLVEYLRRLIPAEKNKDLKKNMVEAMAATSTTNNLDFDDFVAFCKQNKISINDDLIFRFSGLKPVEYIFSSKKLAAQEPMYSDKEAMNMFFQYSKEISKRLGEHLELEFPSRYLERITAVDLRLLKNGIYAYHGKNFRSKVLQYYFYGDYDYIQQFCNNGICGTRETKKKKYLDDTLTATDRANLHAIGNEEARRAKLAFKEDVFIENYDLQAFIKGTADNYTLSSPELRRIIQLKIDWERKQGWIWDKKGISCWDLKSGKRIKLYAKAKGPIGYNGARRLLSYQTGTNLVIEKIDSEEKILQHPLTEHDTEFPQSTLNVFSDNGKFFVYSSGYIFNQRNMFVFDTEHKTLRKLDFGINFYIWGSDQNGLGIVAPAKILNNSTLLVFMSVRGISLGLGIASLLDVTKPRYLEYRFRKSGPSAVFTIATDELRRYLYIDPGFHEPIQRFSLDDILRAKKEFPKWQVTIDPGKADLRYIYSLYAQSDRLFRGDSGVLGVLDLNQKVGNDTNKLSSGSAFDVLLHEGLYATGHDEGYVVIKRFPAR
jgi:hypothetical protein